MKIIIGLIFVFAALANYSFAQDVLYKEKQEGQKMSDEAWLKAKELNCKIIARQIFKDGVEKEDIYRVKAATKKDCIKAVKPYRINFMPHLVKKKTVTYEWKKPEKIEKQK